MNREPDNGCDESSEWGNCTNTSAPEAVFGEIRCLMIDHEKRSVRQKFRRALWARDRTVASPQARADVNHRLLAHYQDLIDRPIPDRFWRLVHDLIQETKERRL